jgi:hypothetical protein
MQTVDRGSNIDSSWRTKFMSYIYSHDKSTSLRYGLT